MVVVGDGVVVAVPEFFYAHESADQQEQAGAGEVEVGDDGVGGLELVAGLDEDIGGV